MHESRKTLQYIKQEDAIAFEISMSTAGKTCKELSARRNENARSLSMTKTNACIAQTFIDDEEYKQYIFKASFVVFELFVACSSIKSFSCRHLLSTYS